MKVIKICFGGLGKSSRSHGGTIRVDVGETGGERFVQSIGKPTWEEVSSHAGVRKADLMR